MRKILIFCSLLICAGDLTLSLVAAAPLNKSWPNKININTARERDISNLENTGPRIASAIIEDRDMNGPYWSCDEIKRIKGYGMGPKWFDTVRDRIKITPEYRCWHCQGIIKLKHGDREGVCPYCHANWPKKVHLKKHNEQGNTTSGVSL